MARLKLGLISNFSHRTSLPSPLLLRGIRLCASCGWSLLRVGRLFLNPYFIEPLLTPCPSLVTHPPCADYSHAIHQMYIFPRRSHAVASSTRRRAWPRGASCMEAADPTPMRRPSRRPRIFCRMERLNS
jgi:hypothetical protein